MQLQVNMLRHDIVGCEVFISANTSESLKRFTQSFARENSAESLKMRQLRMGCSIELLTEFKESSVRVQSLADQADKLQMRNINNSETQKIRKTEKRGFMKAF